jgi:cell division transport system ATP-binding protein
VAESHLVEFRRVSHRYDGGRDVLSDVSFTLARGEMMFLTGASGAGKSTLLRLAARLSVAGRGQVLVQGRDLAQLRPREVPGYRQQLGIVFQNFNLLADRSVFDNVALPLVIQGLDRRDIGRKVRAALDAVGLLQRDTALPTTLSGGEQQRVAIARAIVTKPLLLLADEPTGNLDPQMAFEVMRLFQRFNAVGVSVLVATHAIDLIAPLGGRILHLEQGRISDEGPVAASELGMYSAPEFAS